MENGLLVMLYRADYNSLDIVSPFLEAIVARFCSFSKEAPISRVFTKYVDLVNSIYEKDHASG